MLRTTGLTACLVLVTLAGCLDAEQGPAPEPATVPSVLLQNETVVPAGWNVAFENCSLGAGVAAYGEVGLGPTVPGPWVLADVAEELNYPKISSLGYPIIGRTTGHWHTGVVCELDGASFEWGFVGIAVEPPEWDADESVDHFLLSGFGLPSGPVRDALREVTMADITEAVSATLTLAGTAGYGQYDDASKGVYTAASTVLPYRDFEDARGLRFWWTVPADGSRAHYDHGAGGGGHHPVSFDLVVAAGSSQWISPDQTGIGCHTGTDHHGPQGGQCQLGILNVYSAPAMSLSYGGLRQDVRLSSVWVH